MAKKKTPNKTTIKGKSGVTRRDRRGATNQNSGPTISFEQIITLQDIQLDIDYYNEVEIYEIDPFFKDHQISQNFVVVRMFHENLIKYIDDSNPLDIVIDAWHRQIDARERSTDVEKWVPTPFPYIEKGVIVAISPEVQLNYARIIEEAKSKGIDTSKLKVPQVGDVVEVRSNYSSVWFKENRYYPDKQKQCEDFVRNQTEIRLNHFEHYFRMESYDLVGIYHSNANGKRGYFSDEGTPEWVKDQIKEIENKKSDLEQKEKDYEKALMEQRQNMNAPHEAMIKEFSPKVEDKNTD